METFSEWLGRMCCRFGRCLACRVHDMPEGIGGKCIRCGKIHGWVTRGELQNFARREQFKQMGLIK